MLLFSLFIFFIGVRELNGQINTYSDIDLFSWGTEFRPANPIELLSHRFTSTLIACGQLCNQNVQCRTFDYDSYSLVCRLYEGSVDTGSIMPSGSTSSCVGSVRLQPQFFNAFGRECERCANSRYLVCSPSRNNTCQCPQNTFWNGIQCKNRAYEDVNCSNNQWCREDAGFNCSNLHFCTGYHCGNMTVIKGDLTGNDLTSTRTSNFSLCCASCRNYSGCRAFTWLSAPGTFFGMCYLKWSPAGYTGSSSYHISAYY